MWLCNHGNFQLFRCQANHPGPIPTILRHWEVLDSKDMRLTNLNLTMMAPYTVLSLQCIYVHL